MVGRYQAYLEFHDTGVEWLGEIPKHWHVEKLKFFTSIQPSNVDKKTKEGELPVRLCNYTDVYYNDRIDESLEFMIASATEEQIEKFVLKAGDTVITKDSEDPADIAIPTYVPTDLPGVVCGYHLAMIRPNDLSYGPFIKRVFESGYARAYFCTRSNGLTRYGLGTYSLSNVFYPKPPREEAEQIANFLDHETAKIDTLIDKQQQLIKLLKEKRQAVISHAVTKGLNPAAPMKDSGVEWLGEVPEGWTTVRIKQIASFITSGPRGWSDLISEEGEDVFLQSGDLNNELEILPYKAKKVIAPKGAEGVRTKLIENDVVVCITGANTGRVAVVQNLTTTTYINQHLSLIRPISEKVDAAFIGYALSSQGGRSYFNVTQYGLKEGLSLSNVAEAPLPLPPLNEQKVIVQELQAKLSVFSKINGVAENQVEFLKERRTALISAAVTGNIDVRNWQPVVRESLITPPVLPLS